MSDSARKKTLILNGSPRKNGDTAKLIRALTGELTGEVFVIDCCSAGIAPCADCRRCRKMPGCAIRDGMEDLDAVIRTCDNAVIASPVWFSELTGPLLAVASRFQTYYCARRFRREEAGIQSKRGGVILTGGGDGDPKKALSTAETLLRMISVTRMHPPVMSLATDTLPAAEDPLAAEGVKSLAAFLNGGEG